MILQTAKHAKKRISSNDTSEAQEAPVAVAESGSRVRDDEQQNRPSPFPREVLVTRWRADKKNRVY